MEITAQYLAGFVDGEGCIYVRTCNYRTKGLAKLANKIVRSKRVKARLTIVNVHLPTLQLIAEQWGGKIYARIHGKYYEGRKIRQSWQLNWDKQEELLKVLVAIQPYLIQKRPQVDYFLSEWVPTMRDIRGGGYHLTDEEYNKRLEVGTKLKELKHEEFVATRPNMRAESLGG